MSLTYRDTVKLDVLTPLFKAVYVFILGNAQRILTLANFKSYVGEKYNGSVVRIHAGPVPPMPRLVPVLEPLWACFMTQQSLDSLSLKQKHFSGSALSEF